jgi:tetratricopeptide (TPR) repeat protein
VFDAEKIILLIKFSNHEDKKVSIRAFVGLLLCLQIHKNRYSFYPNINNELNLLFNSDEKIELAQIIYKQLLRAKQTEKITKDIKENIIPLITKIAPKINEDLTINKNKDWDGETENIQQMLEESGVSKKMESFQELMMEGADTNFSSFQHLKDMAFFQNIENWFMPFYHESKDLDGLRNENPEILDMVDNIFFLCDSDKYSFCLNLLRIPSNARETLSEQLKVTSDKKIDDNSEKDISNLYIQDLYRFYKLYKGKDQLIDPFTDSFNIYKSPFFRFLNEENTYIAELADFYFTKQQYEDALYAFQFSDTTTSVETLKKIGYCYQKLMDYRKAIENYEKCEIIEEGNFWVNKNIAFCYKKLSKYDSALKYYKIADSLNENNISIIFNLAVCYTQLKEFEKGLNCFNKIEYLEVEATHSEDYYLYKGHCLWANGKKAEAIENYKKYPYDKLFEELTNSPIGLSSIECIYISDYVRYLK